MDVQCGRVVWYPRISTVLDVPGANRMDPGSNDLRTSSTSGANRALICTTEKYTTDSTVRPLRRKCPRDCSIRSSYWYRTLLPQSAQHDERACQQDRRRGTTLAGVYSRSTHKGVDVRSPDPQMVVQHRNTCLPPPQHPYLFFGRLVQGQPPPPRIWMGSWPAYPLASQRPKRNSWRKYVTDSLPPTLEACQAPLGLF